MKKILAKSLLSSSRLVSRCWRSESRRGGREMGILADWIIFIMVVALMVYVIDPLLILLLWVIGGP
jgi:hypothetical protein